MFTIALTWKTNLKNKAQIKIVGPNIGEEPLLILLSNLYEYVCSEENRNKSFKKYLSIFFLIHLFFYLVLLLIIEEMKTIIWIAFFIWGYNESQSIHTS